MLALANYIMRGRMQAVLVVSSLAVLALLIPPLGILSAAAVALVTLRLGSYQGALVAVTATLASGVLAWVALRAPMFGPTALVSLWVPAWMLALVIRRTVSLPLTVLVAVGAAVLVTAAAYMSLGDPVEYWLSLLREVLLEPLRKSELKPNEAELEQVLKLVARIMTGALAAAGLLNALLALLIGRWWQALLYNPGGFGDEFRALRLPKIFAVASIAVLALAMSGATGAGLVVNLLPLLLVAWILAGLGLAHGWVAARGMSGGWLIVMYVLLLFLLPQLFMPLLIVMAVLDTWLDFRGRAAPTAN